MADTCLVLFCFFQQDTGTRILSNSSITGLKLAMKEEKEKKKRQIAHFKEQSGQKVNWAEDEFKIKMI